MIDYSRSAKQSVLDKRYITDISQICGIPEDSVKSIFEAYNMYILRDIHIAYEPKDVIYIPIPGFCTIRITPTDNGKSKFGIQLHLTKGIKDKYKQKIHNSFFNKKDYFDDYCYKKFCLLLNEQGFING